VAVDALPPVQRAMQPAIQSPVGDDAARLREGEDSPRERAYQAALASPPVVSGTARSSTSTPNGSASSLATEEEQMVTLGDSILRTAIRPGAAAAGSMMPSSGAVSTLGMSQRATTPDTASLDRSRSFADRAAGRASGTTIAALEPAGSPYTLTAGTVIPGLLLTAINSDLPGEIVGQVSRPVYDSRTQRIVLIPRGSRLVGTYDNQVAAGQGRLLVAWTRLIFPDGRSLRLPGLALTDPAGQSGAKDRVDNHWRRVFGNALLLSAISAGAQVSQPAQATVLSTPSAGQVAAGAVGQELSQVAIEILRRGMDVAPTITIRAGQPFNVFLSGDLVFDGPADTSR
jgi:type IV secretion system protein VirB10